MVQAGYAWHYKAYSKDKRFALAEQQARQKKTGLWSDKNPIAPWDYRRGKTSTVKKAPIVKKPETNTPETTKLTHWVTNSSGIRHNSSCRYVKNSKGRSTDKSGGKRGCKICGG